MDAAVCEAIAAVRLDDEVTQERWFEAVCSTYGQLAGSGQPDWDRFVSSLADAALSAGLDRQLVEQFVEHMTANDPNPIETIGRMNELASELPMRYRERPVEAAASGEATTDGYDESAWHGFLAEHGVGWSGTEASWEQFRAWFLYQAEQRGLAVPANGFITYAEGQPDKAAVFAQYGVSITSADTAANHHAADVSAFPEVKQGDSGEWVEYLDAMLTSNGF